MRIISDTERAKAYIERAKNFGIPLSRVKLPGESSVIPEIHSRDCFYLSVELNYSFDEIREFFLVPYERSNKHKVRK